MLRKGISILLILVFGIYINTLKTHYYFQEDGKVCQKVSLSDQHSLKKSPKDNSLFAGCTSEDTGAEIFIHKSKRRYEDIIALVLCLSGRFLPDQQPERKAGIYYSPVLLSGAYFNPHSLRGPPSVA